MKTSIKVVGLALAGAITFSTVGNSEAINTVPMASKFRRGSVAIDTVSLLEKSKSTYRTTFKGRNFSPKNKVPGKVLSSKNTLAPEKNENAASTCDNDQFIGPHRFRMQFVTKPWTGSTSAQYSAKDHKISYNVFARFGIVKGTHLPKWRGFFSYQKERSISPPDHIWNMKDVTNNEGKCISAVKVIAIVQDDKGKTILTSTKIFENTVNPLDHTISHCVIEMEYYNYAVRGNETYYCNAIRAN